MTGFPLPLCLRLPTQPLAERACKLLLASGVGVDAAGCEAGLYRIWLLGVSARDFGGFLSDFATHFSG